MGPSRWRVRGSAGALALTALAALGLAACGGSSNSSSQVSNATATRAEATTQAPATDTSAKQPGSSNSHPRLSTKEGSAPFRVKVGDNSIPEFGSEAPTAQRNRAAAALSSYLRARAGADWQLACSYLAQSVRVQLEKFGNASHGKVSGCAAVLSSLSAGSPSTSRKDVLTHGLAALRFKAGHGFVLFYGPHRQQYVMPVALEGRAWRVTQLAPIPYPLGSQSKGSSSQGPVTP